jgi:archaellum component FlaC
LKKSDLKEILNKLDGKLDNLQKDVTDINLRLTKVETGLDSDLPSIKEDIKEIKSAQKTLTADVADLKGAKSLIIPIIVAVTTSILTLVIRAIPIN